MTWHRPNAHDGRITSGFGSRTPPFPGASAYHEGVDLRAGVHGVDGSVYAAADGRVTRRYVTPMGANVIVLDHGDGITTRYVHMPSDGIYVDVGDRVDGGQRIAIAGKTGAATVHLHFETRIKGVAVNPVPFLEERGITLTSLTAPAAGGGSATAPPMSEEDDDMPLTDADLDRIEQRVWGHKPTGNSTASELLAHIKMRLSNGTAGDRPLPEVAEVLAAVLEIPGAILGYKPTGHSTIAELVTHIKMRLSNGTKPDAAGLSEVADLRVEMLEGFAALGRKLEEVQR